MSAFETITVPFANIDHMVFFHVRQFLGAWDAMELRRTARYQARRAEYKATSENYLYERPPRPDTTPEIEDLRALLTIPKETVNLTFTAAQWLQIERFRQEAPMWIIEQHDESLRKAGFP
jgi:hypothetical protein